MNDKIITGAIFDMDGVLLDSTSVWSTAVLRFLKKIGITADLELGMKLFPMTMEEGADHIIEKYGLDMNSEDVVSGTNDVVYDFYSSDVQLKPGVAQMLESIAAAGIPMTVATATDRKLAEKALEHTGIIGYFSKIFTCSEVGSGKNRPDIYIAAQRFIGTDRKTTWVFEDSLAGIETAGAAGFRTAGVYDAVNERIQPALRAAADVYFSGEMNLKTIIEV